MPTLLVSTAIKNIKPEKVSGIMSIQTIFATRFTREKNLNTSKKTKTEKSHMNLSAKFANNECRQKLLITNINKEITETSKNFYILSSIDMCISGFTNK